MIRSRSPVIVTAIQMASPFAIVIGVYLFFAGHNQPGGGFAAGLVLGAVVALRTVVALPRPQDAMPWFAVGSLLVCGVALVPLFGGEPVLDMVVVERDVPLLGTVKSGSAAIFDLGVTIIVVGLFVALFDGLDADDLAGDEGTS
ncbi:MAG: MnhB domain-containing protein [Actinomycetota bacterium]